MYKSILLAIDLPNRETQGKALETAVSLARNFSAKLTVMTVVPDFGMAIVGTFFPDGFEEKALAATQAELEAYVKDKVPDDMGARSIVAHGTIYSEILRVAKEMAADFIIVASHRPELQDYLLGPNAARVVRHADCSVLVVRDE